MDFDHTPAATANRLKIMIDCSINYVLIGRQVVDSVDEAVWRLPDLSILRQKMK
jgi:hypothetical protein